MADYSEFPTTPTAWQEQQERDAAGWLTVTAQETEDAAPTRRRPDLLALVPGALFVVLALTLMTGVQLPRELVGDGGLFWLVLVGTGIALLVSEMRKVRRRR